MRVPGQPIQEPIHRRFGTSCVCRVYFLCDSTYFHDMQTECQRIKTYRSFLTVHLIYNKFPVIAQFLAPQSLKTFPPLLCPKY